LPTHDPSGFDIVVNATPMGMNGDQSAAYLIDQLTAEMSVADVVTSPEKTRLFPKSSNCTVVMGTEMFVQVI
jgi:shikimate dehydrogenase